jgi:hypothetical protein
MTQSLSPSSHTWKVLEIPLASSMPYANPYAEIEVSVTFTASPGR